MTDTPNTAHEIRQGGRATLPGTEPERRGAVRRKLVIEISADLHQRILSICATRRIPVNQAVREVLERSFPGK